MVLTGSQRPLFDANGIRSGTDALSNLLMARSEEIHHPNPGAAVSFALEQAVALLIQRYTVGIRNMGPVPLSDDSIATQLSTSCLAYLGVAGTDDPIEGDRS